ncbi:hypothetical protein ACF1BQ_005525 [Bradyrhizobium sp. RDT10]
MLGLLPQLYDVRHLEALGGRFALRVTGIGRHGDFTTMAVNRRVVTLTGLPLDEASGAAIADASVRADVFLALWNDMLADLAETTLAHIAAARSARRRRAKQNGASLCQISNARFPRTASSRSRCWRRIPLEPVHWR